MLAARRVHRAGAAAGRARPGAGVSARSRRARLAPTHLRDAVPQALFPEQHTGRRAERSAGRASSRRSASALPAAVANCSGTGHLLAAGGAPMVSLYGPTRPEKYAPFARASICLKAQDYGSEQDRAIPLDAVAAAVERQVAVGPADGFMPAAAQTETNALIGADASR